MPMSNWIRCPKCNNKTRLKIRKDTILKNFPLYCPKCRQEMLIDVQRLDISVITVARRDRRRADNLQIKNAVIGSFYLKDTATI